MSQTAEKSTAFVLHLRSFRESSLIVQAFSRERGLFSLVANGVKGKKGQARKALLRPFVELTIEYRGRSQLKTLAECEAISAAWIQENQLQGERLACAYYANELLTRALPEGQEFALLYEDYQQFIIALKNQQPQFSLLRNFEISLLQAIGMAPDFSSDTNMQPIKRESYYRWQAEQGFVLLANKQDSTDTVSGVTLLALDEGNIQPENQRECLFLSRLLLAEVVGNKPLQSRKLWQHMRLNNSSQKDSK